MAASPAVPLYPAICPGHQKAVVEISYSKPTPDGTFFISACLDKLPMLRDAKTGDWIGTFQGHKGAVWSARLNGDATIAATGSADYTVKVWDSCQGSELATLEHGGVVKSVDFSADGSRLATGGHDKKLRVYDVQRLDAPPALVVPVPDRVRKVAWARDDGVVYVGSDDGAVRAYGARDGALVAEARLDAGGGVADLEVSPDGGTLTVAAGQQVLFLDAATLAVRARHKLSYVVEAASRHASGRRFVAGGSDVHVHVHDAESGAELATNKGHHGTVHCARFAPDGETFASGADDAIIRIWKLEH